MEAPKKTGFWTQHVDPSSGRTYFFNMALGRSYWELPSELQAQVKKPALDALREWDPEAAERKYGATNQHSNVEDDEIRRKREEALAKSRTEAAEAQTASTTLSLEERMALAAQKRKAAEVQSSASGNRLPSSSDGSNAYLELVRQLQQNDDSEEPRINAIRRTLKGSDGSAEGAAKIRLENLDFGVTEEELKELFSDSGDVQSAKVDYDKSGRSNGSATVVFARRSDALAAVKKYNGVELEGKILSVTLSAAPAAAAAPAPKRAPAAAKDEAPRLVISTVNDRFQPRGRGGFRGSSRGGFRGSRGGSRGGRGGGRGPAPTADSLDAELDTYMAK